MRMTKEFSIEGMRTVLFSGALPFAIPDLRKLLPAEIRVIDETDELARVDVVVLGDIGWEEAEIGAAFASAVPPPRFLPQAGFLDEVLFGHDWWTDYAAFLNLALEKHEALQYAKSLFKDTAFRWPTTEQPESPLAGTGASEAEFSETTALFEVGYRITGMSRPQRWHVLNELAVPQLGLREVVETIASHCRARRAQLHGEERFTHALEEWEHDLKRLKDRFYKGEFGWPSTGP